MIFVCVLFRNIVTQTDFSWAQTLTSEECPPIKTFRQPKVKGHSNTSLWSFKVDEVTTLAC